MSTATQTGTPAGTTGRTVPPVRSATGIALAIAIAHGTNDAYSSFLHPLLPRIMEKLGLSIALAAALAMTLSLAASLLQPVLGWIADRHGRRLFVVLGPLASGVFMSMIGLAPTFVILVVLLALGGLGSAAFHPPGASMAARVSEGRGSGMRLSYFSFGGSAGYALGPLIAVGLVGALGLGGMWVAMLPVLVLAPLLYLYLPPGRPPASAEPPPSARGLLTLLRGPLGIIFGISAVGAFVQRVFLTMEPIANASAGGSEAMGALTLSVYLAGQAGGSLLGGFLTDRMERHKLLTVITALSFPAHVLAFWLPLGTPGALFFAVIAGCLNMAVLPPVVVMAQELVPAGAAVSSGIVMGAAWAVGSIGVLGTGLIGDAVGARTAALISFPLMLSATALALHPALRGHTAPAD